MTTQTHQTPLPLNGSVERWRNLYFNKSGESCMGTVLRETAEAARRSFEAVLPQFQEGATLETDKGSMRFEEFAWAMQYPVMG